MANEEVQSPDNELTPKQERFCQLYTTFWEATRAAREAGYSEKTCQQQGYQLLQLTSVKSRIAELTDHALKEIGVSRERILLEAARIAYFDPGKALDDLGQPLQIKDMDEDTRRCVSEIEIFEKFDGKGDDRHVTGLVKNMKFVSKKVGLDILKAATDLATQKLELTGKDGKPIETKDVSEMPDEQLNARIAALMAKAEKPSKDL